MRKFHTHILFRFVLAKLQSEWNMIIQPQMAVAYEYYIQDNKDRQQNDRLLAAAPLGCDSFMPIHLFSRSVIFLHLVLKFKTLALSLTIL